MICHAETQSLPEGSRVTRIAQGTCYDSVMGSIWKPAHAILLIFGRLFGRLCVMALNGAPRQSLHTLSNSLPFTERMDQSQQDTICSVQNAVKKTRRTGSPDGGLTESAFAIPIEAETFDLYVLLGEHFEQQRGEQSKV